MNKVNNFRLLALISYFLLMATMILWIIIAPHDPNYPTGIMLIFGVLPLLFPLRGLLHARPYTHAWTSFLMLFYFTLGVGEAYSDVNLIYSGLSIVFSSFCFVGCLGFVKFNAKLQTESQNKMS